MRTSYKVCSLLLVMIILVMIVGGIIQDRRAKRARIIDSVSKTMDAAGCKEVSSDDDPEQDEKNADSKLTKAKIEDVTSSVLAENRLSKDESRNFSAIIGNALHDARYRIEEIEIDGSNAKVKVEIFYGKQSDYIDMEFTYGKDGWSLVNGEDAALSLFSN